MPDTETPLVLKASRAFTLIEILVVIVVIGVIVSVATLAVGVLGRDSEAEEQAQRYWAVLRQALEEAELQGLDLAVFVAADGYELLRYDARRREWLMIEADRLFARRSLPEGLRFRLWLENREVVLKPGFPNRAKPDEHQKSPPQILLLSSGEVMPFELHIERDAAPALWRVLALADNDLRVEQRKSESERDWFVVAQTRPPAKDQKDAERLSNARR